MYNKKPFIVFISLKCSIWMLHFPPN
jgi:hypothetical protein